AGFATRLRSQIRENTFDSQAGTITVSADRAEAMAQVAQHYVALFGNDADLLDLRKAYAMKNDTVHDPEYRQALTAFIWWSAWAAVTDRPGKQISYTNNWP